MKSNEGNFVIPVVSLKGLYLFYNSKELKTLSLSPALFMNNI